jgi:hypothetical protein
MTIIDIRYHYNDTNLTLLIPLTYDVMTIIDITCAYKYIMLIYSVLISMYLKSF